MNYAMRHAEELLLTPAAMLRWCVDIETGVCDLEEIWTRFFLDRGYDWVVVREEEIHLEMGIQRCVVYYPSWAIPFNEQLPWHVETGKFLLWAQVMYALIYAWEHMD